MSENRQNSNKGVKVRTTYIRFMEVVDSNPNGDPDRDNQPRRGGRNDRGYISAESEKRKIRDFIAMKREGEDGYDLYMDNNESLNSKHRRFAAEVRAEIGDEAADKDKKAFKVLKGSKAKKECFDIRLFGVMGNTGTDEEKIGTHRGAVQFSDPVALNPVEVVRHSGTRIVQTKDDKQEKSDESGGGTFWHKYQIPYVLCQHYGYVDPRVANSDPDLDARMREADVEDLEQAMVFAHPFFRSANRTSISVPLLVKITEPDDFTPIQDCYIRNMLQLIWHPGKEKPEGVDKWFVPAGQDFGFEVRYNPEILPMREGVKIEILEDAYGLLAD